MVGHVFARQRHLYSQRDGAHTALQSGDTVPSRAGLNPAVACLIQMVCTCLDMAGGSTCTLASGCGPRLQRSTCTLRSTRTCTASVGSARAGGLRSCLDGCPSLQWRHSITANGQPFSWRLGSGSEFKCSSSLPSSPSHSQPLEAMGAVDAETRATFA